VLVAYPRAQGSIRHVAVEPLYGRTLGPILMNDVSAERAAPVPGTIPPERDATHRWMLPEHRKNPLIVSELYFVGGTIDVELGHMDRQACGGEQIQVCDRRGIRHARRERVTLDSNDIDQVEAVIVERGGADTKPHVQLVHAGTGERHGEGDNTRGVGRFPPPIVD
jgi:hypothetical protein